MSLDMENINKIPDQAAKQAVQDMAEQEIANTEQQEAKTTAAAEPKKKSFSPAKTVQGVMDGSFLTKGQLFSLIPFIFYVVILIIIAIGNTYYAEKMVRQIEQLKKDLKELRYEQITTRSELMYLSKQSEVARRLKVTGLKESTTPPEKIMIKATEDPKNTKTP